MNRTEETLRVLAFVGVVGLVYVAAAVVLLRWLLIRPRPRLGWIQRLLMGLAAAGVLCILYGRFLEPRWIEVTQTRVPTSRLPPGHRGVRIVHLSDVHSDPAPLLEEQLPDVVAGLRPDLIVFTGDCANSPGGIPVFRALLASLARIAPTYAVKGNWDVWYFRDVDRFGGTGAIELAGTAAQLDVGDTTVHIVGAAHEAEGGLAAPLADLPADGPCILLHHCPYPDLIPAPYAARVDLMCSGHVHGGQVALPFYGALLTLSKHGKRYEQGLYTLEGGGSLYVSRGIGMEGSMPRVRFCARPEVALIELIPVPAR